MSDKKTAPDDELSQWVDCFRAQLDVEESTTIYNTLKENKFKTRMQLKLITGSELEIMFKGEKALSLGARALLQYQINLLNEQSPLLKKSLKKPITTAKNNMDIESSTSSIENTER